MTEQEKRQWAIRQATTLFRNGETVAVLKFAKEIYDFVEGRSDVVEKTPTKENCPETFNSVWDESKMKITTPKLKSENELNQTGILRHMQNPLTPYETHSPVVTLEPRGFDTLEELMHYIKQQETN